MSLKALVIGSGGREHALAWALRQGPSIGKLWALPGNVGMLALAERASLNPMDAAAVARWAVEKKADLAVIGPEVPLAAGLADALRQAGVATFGPGQAAARLESSKAFAKDFMRRHALPTAESRSFSDPALARDFLHSPEGARLRVVKADGLAAGKGVRICSSLEETLETVEDFMVAKVHGASGAAVVLEEVLAGREATLMALCDGRSLVPLLASQDHKRLLDGDAGPNTGGMGAVAPYPLEPATWDRIRAEIFQRFMAGLEKDGLSFRGLIYFGLMLTPGGPKLLEFNVRFGDPETQAVLPLLDDDLGELLLSTAEGRLEGRAPRWKAGAAVCVILASRGYPHAPQSGRPLSGLGQLPEGLLAFHAGTDIVKGRWQTSGGRVVGLTGLGENIQAAREKAYAAAGSVQFEGCQYRRDIGLQAIQRRLEIMGGAQ